MNAPKRWLETEAASAEVMQLLRVARPPAPLDSGTRSRSARCVAALSLVPVAAAASSISWASIALGAGLGMLGTLATLSAAQLVLDREQPTSGAEAVADRAVAPAAASRTPPQAAPSASFRNVIVEAPAASPRTPAITSSAVSETATSEDQLAREIALLETARRKLGASPAAALSALRDHEVRFPAGQLRIEREFLIVDALVRLGRRSEAEARARSLAQQAPQSLYGERLNEILGPPR